MSRGKTSIIQQVLNETSELETKKIQDRMLIAAKIEDAMKAKGWNKTDLLKALGRTNASVITKWLSGTHNFTQDTLTEIGNALGVSFLDTRISKKEVTLSFRVEVSQRTFTNGNKERTAINKNANTVSLGNTSWSTMLNLA